VLGKAFYGVTSPPKKSNLQGLALLNFFLKKIYGIYADRASHVKTFI